MKTADVTQCVIIFVVFFLLFFSTILIAGIGNVNENWASYRCNPLVMPFAPIFGHDPVENFQHCTKSTQKTSMNNIMKPFNKQMSGMKKDTVQNKSTMRAAAHRQQGVIALISAISNQLTVLSTNAAVESNRASLGVNNTFKKMAGVMQVMSHTVRGLTLITKSIRNQVKKLPFV